MSGLFTSTAGQDEALARKIVQLFNEDQALLADLEPIHVCSMSDLAIYHETRTKIDDERRVSSHRPEFL
jgi:hypothetical protein